MHDATLASEWGGVSQHGRFGPGRSYEVREVEACNRRYQTRRVTASKDAAGVKHIREIGFIGADVLPLSGQRALSYTTPPRDN